MKKILIAITVALSVIAATPGFAANPMTGGGGSSAAATTSSPGIIETCTDAEYTAGIKTDCAGTPANAKVELDKKAPSTNIALTALANQAAYTLTGNATAGAAAPTAIAPVASGIWACNAASACAYYTSISISDSAAQFYSATASKGDLKFDQTGIANTKHFTVKYTAADDYTYTPTFTGNTSVTFPTSGTLAVTTHTAQYAATPVIGDADDFDNNFTGDNLYGGTYIVNAAGTILLPDATAGMNFTIVLEGAVATLIEPLATGTDDTIVMNGLAAAQGEYIESSTIGATCVFQYRAADSWMATCKGFVEDTVP